MMKSLLDEKSAHYIDETTFKQNTEQRLFSYDPMFSDKCSFFR